MTETSTKLPKLSFEQRRAAAGQFERANEVLKAEEYDYGLQLLLTCCKIDPVNLIYRRTLRQSQRAKFQNNERGQSFAYVRSFWRRMALQRAMLKGDYLEALVQCELIFMRNPWDLATHLTMAQAFENLGWPDHALWTLEQIRPSHPKNPKVNRPLARLYERRGLFNQAIALWEMVRTADPNDLEAARKAKDLAASATIAKGKYEDAIKTDAPAESAATIETATEQPVLEQTDTIPSRESEDRHPKEVTALRERIKQNPKNANAYLQLARLYRKAEQLDKAQSVLTEGLTATGNNFEIAQELFDLDIDPFRQDLAITEEQLRKNSSDKDLQQAREKLSKEINLRELEYYRRRSDRFPTETASRFEMGLRLLRAGQTDEAIKELQQIRNDPRFHGKALFYLGLCFQSRKNWRLAQRNFEEAMQHLGATDTFLRKETMYLLSVGYAAAGETDRAIDLGLELANLDFNYKNIGTLLDEWQSKVAK